MDHEQQLRNLRDFLLVYNRMTEICFQRCTSNLNYRNLTMDEERCVDNCAGKLIRSNHRLMGTYVQLMPRIVQKRLEEMENKAAETAKAAAAPNPQRAVASGGADAETPPGPVAESSAWGIASAATGPTSTTEGGKALTSLAENAVPPTTARKSGANPPAVPDPSVHAGQQPQLPS
ncbi:mitochondrial import inner membrane translocase subunit Tim10 B [Arapaima gigas]